MAQNPSMTYAEILNNSTELGPSIKISTGAVNAVSTNVIAATYVKIYCTKSCWVVFGAAPVAAVADGFATFIQEGVVHEFRITSGLKCGAIRETADGYLYITVGR